MNKITVNYINRIINYLIIHNGSSIIEMHEVLKIPREDIRKILLYLYDNPFGGIFIYYKKYKEIEDFNSVNTDIIDGLLSWHIDISRMELIPTVDFTDEEKIFLHTVLKNVVIEKAPDSGAERDGPAPCISIMNMHLHDPELYQYNFYEELKKGIVYKRAVEMDYECNNEHLKIYLEPLGVIFSSDRNSWYLVGRNHEGKIYPYRMDRVQCVRLLDVKFEFPEDFSLPDYAKRYWGMEVGEKHYVHIVFKKEGNVFEKVYSRLAGSGELCFEDGVLRFKGEIQGINFFKNWLRGFGSSAIVIEPEWLKEEMISSYRKILDNYQNIEKYRAML